MNAARNRQAEFGLIVVHGVAAGHGRSGFLDFVAGAAQNSLQQSHVQLLGWKHHQV